jgi:hypothetical protein
VFLDTVLIAMIDWQTSEHPSEQETTKKQGLPLANDED